LGYILFEPVNIFNIGLEVFEKRIGHAPVLQLFSLDYPSPLSIRLSNTNLTHIIWMPLGMHLKH